MQQAAGSRHKEAAYCQLTSQLTGEALFLVLGLGLGAWAWCLVPGAGLVPGGTFGSNRMLHATFRGGTNVTPLDGPESLAFPLLACLFLGRIFFIVF